MVVRSRRKILKKRGTKWCGYGSKKKHRGGGSRGGRGNAGLMKHKKIHMVKYDKDHFGKKGYTIINESVIKTLNLRDLQNLSDKSGKTELNIHELGYDKLLGSGNLTKPLIIKATAFSKKAKEKIEEIGGTLISE